MPRSKKSECLISKVNLPRGLIKTLGSWANHLPVSQRRPALQHSDTFSRVLVTSVNPLYKHCIVFRPGMLPLYHILLLISSDWLGPRSRDRATFVHSPKVNLPVARLNGDGERERERERVKGRRCSIPVSFIAQCLPGFVLSRTRNGFVSNSHRSCKRFPLQSNRNVFSSLFSSLSFFLFCFFSLPVT